MNEAARQPRRRGRSHPGALLSMAVHELAQPTAAASLAVEAASLLLQRGDTAEAERKLARAAHHLHRLQDQLLAFGNAQGHGPPGIKTDLAELFSSALPHCALPPMPPVTVRAGPLLVVLRQLASLLPVDRSACVIRVTADSTHVTLRAECPGTTTARLRFWLGILRRSGAPASSRDRDDRFRVLLRLPLALDAA